MSKAFSILPEVREKLCSIEDHRRSSAIVFGRGGGLYMSKSYSAWVGRQVVLQIETGKSQVPLRGQVVNESSIAVRFRLDGCWDVDIFKEMILGVEADTYGAFHPSSLGPSNKALSASRSGSTAMLNWNRGLDFWCSKNLSWQLCWKTFISTGLAGSVLFVLALHVSVSEPATHFAHFICGYLGLLFCAVSLSCGVLVVNYSVKPQSHIFAEWSKPFASFLDWLRQPIHL